MGFLDFIKNRNAQQKAESPARGPETAKQMYTREAGQEKQGFRLEDKMPAEQLAKAREAKQVSISGGQNVPGNDSPAPFPTPASGATNPQPMRQMSMQQDNTAPALSPTSAQKGAPESDRPSPASSAPSSTPKPTLPRATPSWER